MKDESQGKSNGPKWPPGCPNLSVTKAKYTEALLAQVGHHAYGGTAGKSRRSIRHMLKKKGKSPEQIEHELKYVFSLWGDEQ